MSGEIKGHEYKALQDLLDMWKADAGKVMVDVMRFYTAVEVVRLQKLEIEELKKTIEEQKETLRSHNIK